MSNEDLIRAFHLMWDNFPEAVMITQKSREIVAALKLLTPANRNLSPTKVILARLTVIGFLFPKNRNGLFISALVMRLSTKKIDRTPSQKSDSLHGLTKGTELESTMAALAQGEANGVMMYYALARLAKEQGLNDAAAIFIDSANQEAVHAGFYATLNGKYPKDFWNFVAGIKTAETKGEDQVKALADKVRAAGLTVAADEMEIFAKQEGHHGIVLGELLDKYAPKKSDVAGKKWVCSICGYEHIGDNPPEICPRCKQPSTVFKKQ